MRVRVRLYYILLAVLALREKFLSATTLQAHMEFCVILLVLYAKVGLIYHVISEQEPANLVIHFARMNRCCYDTIISNFASHMHNVALMGQKTLPVCAKKKQKAKSQMQQVPLGHPVK